MKRLVLALVACSSLLTGCAVGFTEAGGAYGYAVVPPPVAQVEVMGVAPGPNYFWVGGHYYWSGGRYAWRHGYWDLRRPGRAWIGGAWRYHPSRGYYYAPGYWR